MKIAVLSDIHDHIDNLDKSLEKIKQSGCESIIVCGDLCSPFVIPHLLSVGIHTYLFFGNNDGDIASIYKQIKSDIMEVWSPSQEYAEITLDNKKIAFCHYPHMAKMLALSDEYDAVFHGHTHKAYMQHTAKTVLANPGSVCGIISGKYGSASFGIYDTVSGTFEHIYLFN